MKSAYPRIALTMSIEELIAFCMMLKLGKMFTHPKEREQVGAVLSRVGKKLEALGVPRDMIDKLVNI